MLRMALLAVVGTVALIVAVMWFLQSFSEPRSTRAGDVACDEFCVGLPVMVRTAASEVGCRTMYGRYEHD